MSRTAIFMVIARGLFVRDFEKDDDKPTDGGSKNVNMREAEVGEEVELAIGKDNLPAEPVRAFVDLTRAKLGIVEEVEDEDLEEDEEDEEEDEEDDELE